MDLCTGTWQRVTPTAPGSVALLILAVPLFLASIGNAEKAPWDLSLEERAAARTRLFQEQTARHDKTDASLEPQAWLDISGAVTPEALSPVQLFNDLISRFDPSHIPPAEIPLSRLLVEQKAVALGFGKEFVPKLSRIAADLYQATGRAKALALALPAGVYDSPELTSASNTACRLSAEALQTALSTFGRERFLRFLYRGWAPQFNVSTDDVDGRKMLWAEGGCQ
ncbi:MAG: hypothetical protein ABI609_10865 [Acidobacteriota bacterium]